MTTTERNRLIKATLSKAFGRDRVKVRGSRGTAYGWVSIHIDWTPRDLEQDREMQTHVWALLAAAKLNSEIDTYGYNDPGSDYGYGSKCSISFNDCRYHRTMKHSDGTMSVIREWGGQWESLSA